MKISKFLFPGILLVIFLLVIALGIVSGYWQTQGGGRRGHSAIPTAPVPVVVTLEDTPVSVA
jgi:hypothetical protein